jgi:type II secretory pathway pseudopilin PulG
VLPVRKLQSHNGFSLTEVLFAVGTLAIAMLFIAGTFPVAIYFSTIATERTIAAVVADEAFAKIRLYAIGAPNDPGDDIDIGVLKVDRHTDFNDVNAFPATFMFGLDPNEFTYPSDRSTPIWQKKYFWSALCRQVEPGARLVQVTVFVSRKIGEGGRYWIRNSNGMLNPVGSFYPVPVDVNVSRVGSNFDELLINFDDQANPVEKTFINDGCTIVDDETGQIYRVLERYADYPRTPVREDEMIRLDRPWKPDIMAPPDKTWRVWVVPPPANGGRYPCIAVYQKVIRF